MQQRIPVAPSLSEAVWRHRWLVSTLTIGFAGLAIAVVLLAPARYQATSVLVVQDPRTSQIFDSSGLQAPDRYVQDQVAILRSGAVALRATEIAAQSDPAAAVSTEELVDRTEIGSGRSSNVIQVVSTDADATRAIVLVNSVAEAYQEIRRSQAGASFVRAIEELDESIAALDQESQSLQTAIEELRFSDPARANLVDQYEGALTTLSELQAELSITQEEGRTELRNEIDDITQQLQNLRLILELDLERPDLVALINRQSEATSQRSALRGRRAQLAVDAELTSGVAQYFPATTTELAGLSLPVALAGGGFAGFLIGAALAYLLAGKRNRIESHLVPQDILSAPLLAVIPDFGDEGPKSEVPVYRSPRSRAAEAFRFAAAGLELQSRKGEMTDESLFTGLHTVQGLVVVVSAEEGDGKSIAVANTALASCWTGNKVLVIDADFGSQKQAELLQQTEVPRHGLADVIVQEVSLRRAVRRVELSVELRLDLLTRGQVPVSATDLLRSPEAGQFFASVADDYDLVLIDTPPLLRVAYSSMLCHHAGRAMVVVPHGSDLTTLEDLADRLHLVGTPVTGYIYNRAPVADRASYEGSLKDVVGSTQSTGDPSQRRRRH